MLSNSLVKAERYCSMAGMFGLGMAVALALADASDWAYFALWHVSLLLVMLATSVRIVVERKLGRRWP